MSRVNYPPWITLTQAQEMWPLDLLEQEVEDGNIRSHWDTVNETLWLRRIDVESMWRILLKTQPNVRE